MIPNLGILTLTSSRKGSKKPNSVRTTPHQVSTSGLYFAGMLPIVDKKSLRKKPAISAKSQVPLVIDVWQDLTANAVCALCTMCQAESTIDAVLSRF